MAKKKSAKKQSQSTKQHLGGRRDAAATRGSRPPVEVSPGAKPKPGALRDRFAELLTSEDLHYFNEGTHRSLYRCLGARPVEIGGERGCYFAVWAPNAQRVTVIGEFNGWSKESHPLEARGGSGIWEGFIPGVDEGAVYKYHIVSRHGGYAVDKADPMARASEVPPRTGSVVASLEHDWSDAEWMSKRGGRNSLSAPMSIYEVHLGSWRRSEDNQPLTYRELGPMLADYAHHMGFTHVELMPIMEHPFYGSWGYQTTGYFAPTSRYGSPQDFMAFIETLHQRGIGVILDWVPSHFPTDEHGPGYFDGTHLYEHSDERLGFHPDWKSFIFNYGRHEVRSFLTSSAMIWLNEYHIDGLRVDAVASMLYRDYSRKEGEWIPNEYGGNENIEAIEFLRWFNASVYAEHPDAQTAAEESTSWPMVSRPTYVGGLGFGFKWDMGWMHDTLQYMSRDPVHRKHHHNEITFRSVYAFSENFVLPLSHDEVVHGKGSLLAKMPGDDWQKFANCRLLFSYMYSQPGKKLLFMGGEIGQWREWAHDTSIDWNLLDYTPHEGLRKAVRALNHIYREEPALHELDCDPRGFEWIDGGDTENSVLSYIRKSERDADDVIVVCNFTPAARHNYRVGAPRSGFWKEIFNSDAEEYGGSGQGNMGGVNATPVRQHGRPHSLNLTVPPLGVVMFKREGGAR